MLGGWRSRGRSRRWAACWWTWSIGGDPGRSATSCSLWLSCRPPVGESCRAVASPWLAVGIGWQVAGGGGGGGGGGVQRASRQMIVFVTHLERLAAQTCARPSYDECPSS